jgi:hypothetical protein
MLVITDVSCIFNIKKQTGLVAPPTASVSTVDAYEKLIPAIPEFADFGKFSRYDNQIFYFY